MGSTVGLVGIAAVLDERIRRLRELLKRPRKRRLSRARAVLGLALSLTRVRLREAIEPRLVWTLGTESKKRPQKLVGVPTAHVGPTVEHARNSCNGCTWLDNGCNAHEGRRVAVLGKITKGNAGDTLEAVLAKAPKAKAIRLTVIGDVGGGVTVTRSEVFEAIETARSRNLAVLGFSHFWRNPENQDLRPELMASVEASDDQTVLEAADEALGMEWRPAGVLSPDLLEPLIDDATGSPRLGSFVVTPNGNKLFVCPYYTRGSRCNNCRLCDPKSKAWKNGRYQGIAFVESGPRIKKLKRLLPLSKTQC